MSYTSQKLTKLQVAQIKLLGLKNKVTMRTTAYIKVLKSNQDLTVMKI